MVALSNACTFLHLVRAVGQRCHKLTLKLAVTVAHDAFSDTAARPKARSVLPAQPRVCDVEHAPHGSNACRQACLFVAFTNRLKNRNRNRNRYNRTHAQTTSELGDTGQCQHCNTPAPPGPLPCRWRSLHGVVATTMDCDRHCSRRSASASAVSLASWHREMTGLPTWPSSAWSSAAESQSRLPLLPMLSQRKRHRWRRRHHHQRRFRPCHLRQKRRSRLRRPCPRCHHRLPQRRYHPHHQPQPGRPHHLERDRLRSPRLAPALVGRVAQSRTPCWPLPAPGGHDTYSCSTCKMRVRPDQSPETNTPNSQRRILTA